MGSVKVAILLCNHLLGEGIQRFVTDKTGVGSALSYATCEGVISAGPDLLITDFRILCDRLFGLLIESEIKILLIETPCMHSIMHEELFRFIGRGVVGVLSSNCGLVKLGRAIESVISGELWLDARSLSDILNRPHGIGGIEQRSPLTATEINIVKMICKGFRNKEIMKALDISEQAVKSHLSRIYKKVGVGDRLQLAIQANRFWSNNSGGV